MDRRVSRLTLAGHSLKSMSVRAMPDQGQLGRAIRELRHERGMTGEELAFAAQVDLAHLNRAENHGRNLTWTTFVAVAGALGISASELVTRAEEVAARDRAESGRDGG